MPDTRGVLLVESRHTRVPDSVVKWACSALQELDASRAELYPCYPHTAEDSGFVILDIVTLLALAQDATEDDSLPLPPRSVLTWLRRQSAAIRRRKAARFIWIG